MIDLAKIQRDQGAWELRNFGEQPSWTALVGMMEELGELAHAHLKMHQGIRGSQEQHAAAREDAVGDIVVYMLSYCTKVGIDLEKAIERTWAEVSQRNWKFDPNNGSQA